MNPTLRWTWLDVRREIRRRILESVYLPGDRLPRDEDLARELGCSRATVQRAMKDLAASGTVERRRKGGTHVRPNPISRATLDIPITRLEVEEKGWAYSHQLIASRMKIPPAGVAARLNLPSGEPLLQVEALHFADHRPYIFEDRWICTKTVPEITDVDLHEISANEWLVRYRPFSRADLRFYALKADQRLRGLLETEPSAALFASERTTFIGEAPITTVTAIAGPGYQVLTRIGSPDGI